MYMAVALICILFEPILIFITNQNVEKNVACYETMFLYSGEVFFFYDCYMSLNLYSLASIGQPTTIQCAKTQPCH